jgi:hypothetical protein
VASGVIAVALFIAAELLPWMTIRATAVPTGPLAIAASDERAVSIEVVGGGLVVAYYLGSLLLLVLIGLALVSRPYTRRMVCAAGFGLVTGLLIVLIGLIRRAGEGGELAVYYQPTASAASAPYVAVAAVLAAAAALALSGWHPGLRSRTRPAAAADPTDDPDAEPGPIDLTVSSA